MRLLLVEDDAMLGDGIRAGLMLASYAVDWVQDGKMALLALADHSYAACILDPRFARQGQSERPARNARRWRPGRSCC